MTAISAMLNRSWRLVMTGFCFGLFGTGGLLLSSLWFNLLLLLQPDAQKRRYLARRSIAISFRWFLMLLRFLRVLDYRIHGAETLHGDRGCLVVANHPTLIDYVLLASIEPELDCLVKSALLKNPFVSGVIRAADYLINREAGELLDASRQRLSRGETILIFPEGTRTRTQQAMSLQRGAANIAVRCGADLRVILINCSEHFLDKQTKWYNVPQCKPIFTVQVCERIPISDFYDANASEGLPALAARRLNRYLLYRLSSNQTTSFVRNE